jgi:hypothetical protein
MMGKFKNLSEVEHSQLKDIINELIDEGYEGIINDLTPLPNVEYSLDELLLVWDDKDEN